MPCGFDPRACFLRPRYRDGSNNFVVIVFGGQWGGRHGMLSYPSWLRFLWLDRLFPKYS